MEKWKLVKGGEENRCFDSVFRGSKVAVGGKGSRGARMKETADADFAAGAQYSETHFTRGPLHSKSA